MTNNYVNKLSYISFSLVQSKVLKSEYYLLTNLKVENFLHEIKWIGEVYPFFCCVMKGVHVYAEKTNNISSC